MKSIKYFSLLLTFALFGCNDEPAAPAPQASNANTKASQPAPAPAPAPAPVADSPTNPTGDVPAWQPDPAVLDQLGDYVDFEGYQIRIPKGFESDPPPPYPNSVGKGWGSKDNKSSIYQYIELYIMTPPGLDANQILAQEPHFYENFVNHVKPHYENWQSQNLDRGKINGMDFYRVKCQGINKELQINLHLVIYMAFSGNKFITFQISSNKDNILEPSNISNASVLTFRKK